MNLGDIVDTSSGNYAFIEVDDNEFQVQQGTKPADYKIISFREMGVYFETKF